MGKGAQAIILVVVVAFLAGGALWILRALSAFYWVGTGGQSSGPSLATPVIVIACLAVAVGVILIGRAKD